MILGLLAPCLLCLGPGPTPGPKPNLVVIVVDDLNMDVDLPQVSTPNIDALSSRGVRFTRAYASHPVCMPSRVSMLAGQRTDHTQVVLSTVQPPPSAINGLPYLPLRLRNAGYYSGGAGKVFHSPQPECWDEYHDASDDPWIPKPSLPHTENAKGMIIGGPFLNGPTGALGKMRDTKNTDSMLVMLAEAKQRLDATGQPFALWLGLIATHDPFVYPEKFDPMYQPSDVPPLPAEETSVAWKAFVNAESWTTHWFYDPQWGATEEERRVQARLCYFRCISYVDEEVGRVLDALTNLQLADDTLVVLVGDHGWSFSEHAHVGKTTGFDEDALAPLIVADPGLPGTHGAAATTPVSQLDLYPTLMDLLGLDQAGLDGESLAPMLADLAAPHGPVFFTTDEEFAFNLTRHVVKRVGGAIWKLGVWEADDDIPQVHQLYDLSVDPGEYNNRYPDPAASAVAAELTQDLVAAGLLGPSSRNFSNGVEGLAGLPGLTSTAPPLLGTSIHLVIGNSSGAPALGLLCFGLDGADPAEYGLAVQPQITKLIDVAAEGTSLPLVLPPDPTLHELPIGFQALQLDPASPKGYSASRGLALFLWNGSP